MSKIIQYLREVREEFHHITWPARDTLIQLTLVVISISIIVSLILGGFDFLFLQTYRLASQAKQAPIQLDSTQNNDFIIQPQPSTSSATQP